MYSKLLFNYKIQLIFLTFLTFIVGAIFSDFKEVLGKDERLYIANGFNLINYGFESTKILPLISIIFYFFSSLFIENLIGIKIIYVLSFHPSSGKYLIIDKKPHLFMGLFFSIMLAYFFKVKVDTKYLIHFFNLPFLFQLTSRGCPFVK